MTNTKTDDPQKIDNNKNQPDVTPPEKGINESKTVTYALDSISDDKIIEK